MRLRILALSREQVTVYKGMGILLIVLHNFLHSVPPIVGENEFSFRWAIVERFAAAMASSPQEWPRALFSYLGHYGVQIFVFASAYGLWRRYSGHLPPYRSFLAARFSRVYVPFLLAIVVYACLWYPRAFVLGDPEPLAWRSLLFKALLVSNVVPGEGLRPVGPWWFAPFILQFYLVFPVLAFLLARYGPWALGGVGGGSLVLEWALNPLLRSAGLNLNYTVFGHLPVLCLGFYAATRGDVRIGWVAVVIAAGVFLAGNVDPTMWLVADAAAAVLLFVVPYPFLIRASQRGGVVYRLLLFFGTISLPLFLVNGFLRSPFAQAAIAVNIWWFTLVCAGVSLIFSSAVAMVLTQVDRWIRSQVSRRDRPVPLPGDAPTAV